MQQSTFFQQVSPIIVDLVSVIIAGLLMFLARIISSWLKTRMSSEAYRQLSDVALACVMSLQQTTVNSLKDPSKPGEWNDDAAQDIKSRAASKIRDLAGASIDELHRQGWSPQKVEDLISKLIEAHVLKAKTFSQTRAANTSEETSK